MQVDLSIIPEGWWLYGLFHNHTPILRKGDVHIPFEAAGRGENWSCKIQHHSGGRLVEASGLTPQMAVQLAVEQVSPEYRHAETINTGDTNV